MATLPVCKSICWLRRNRMTARVLYFVGMCAPIRFKRIHNSGTAARHSRWCSGPAEFWSRLREHVYCLPRAHANGDTWLHRLMRKRFARRFHHITGRTIRGVLPTPPLLAVSAGALHRLLPAHSASHGRESMEAA